MSVGSHGRVWCIVPTYRETDQVRRLLESFDRVHRPGTQVLIVNANPGDETSSLIRSLGSRRVREVESEPRLFWAGLVSAGIELVLSQADDNDYVALVNADVSFREDVVAALVETARGLGGRCQVGALTVAGTRVVSSGVIVRSWLLACTRHPYAGMKLADVPGQSVVQVDFLPTRFTLIPVTAIRAGGMPNTAWLPHYASDYEYTGRLRRCGFSAFVATGARVTLDAENTGSLFRRSAGLVQRVRGMFSIKSNYNPVRRCAFVWLSYPRYARPTASLIMVAKGMLEVAFGGAAIKRSIGRLEMGFSGTQDD